MHHTMATFVTLIGLKIIAPYKVLCSIISSPVGSLCHTPGVDRRPSYLIRRTSSVSTITTRNKKDVKSIFGANVQHVPGLCLLGIGAPPPTLVIKLWLKNQIFTFSTSFLKKPADGVSYYARRFLSPRPLYLFAL